ncbi:MAG: ABC transporter substrate-binding protein [Candidatus Tectimicrobiota bacterium]
MQRGIWRQGSGTRCRYGLLVPLFLLLIPLLVRATPTAAQSRTQRLVFASAGFTESQRFWTIARPEHLQYDPCLETLLDVEPQSGAYTARLAERWQASPDLQEWTFFLRRGVQFHYGFGEFTARDVVHSHALMLRPEATATMVGIWREVEELKVVNDYQIVFRLKRPMAILPYAVSRAGDLRIVSKAQWDAEGLEGFEKRPAGTGSYRYVGRQTGVSLTYERVEKHWQEQPDFQELEIRLVPEETTRFAMLMSGEAQVADLPRELQKDAVKRGMKILSSSQPVDWMTIYIGGQYYMPNDPKFQTEVPWTDIKVRQALNMAVNRQEILDTIFAGKGTLAYVSGWLPISEGWNPAWAQRFEPTYGYNPARARALLQEAGYASGLKLRLLAFVNPGESEGPQVAEALGIYFKEVGIETEIEALDWAKVRDMFRNKVIHCCLWPNIISWRPVEDWIRVSYYSKGTGHNFEDAFIEQRYLTLTQTVNPEDRQRLTREIGDHLFESFPDIPLIWFYNEVVVNPAVVADWKYPGLGAGRSTHFHLLRAAR